MFLGEGSANTAAVQVAAATEGVEGVFGLCFVECLARGHSIPRTR